MLETFEVDSFLAWLFSSVAKKPPALRIRECAAVARYLQWLSWQGVPSEVLQDGPEALERYHSTPKTEAEKHRWGCLLEISQIIWDGCLRFGQFEPSDRAGALRLLNKLSETYLAGNPYFGPATELVQSCEIPRDRPYPAVAPNLMSAHSSGGYVGQRRVIDDLSDRIYGAYHALAGVKNRSERIAQALSNSKAKLTRAEWTYAEVNDRIKMYEKQEKRALLKQGLPGDAVTPKIEQFRFERADEWVSRFRFHESVASESSVRG